MNVYTTTDFEGHWPVGVAAVIVARDFVEAVELMTAQFKAHGLHTEQSFTMQQVDTTRPNAVILNDGEY